MTDERMNASLVARIDLHDALVILRVAPLRKRPPAFEPGQFATLGLAPDAGAAGSPYGGEELLTRPFSVASAPGEDYLEFFVRRVDNGALTPLLFNLEVGAPLFLDEQVLGDFTMVAAPADKDLVMISTGTGLGPFMSMLRHYRDQGRWRRFVVIHGCRVQADLGYRAELEELAAADASVVYLPTLTREPEDSGWSGLRGRVDAILAPEAYGELVGSSLEPDRCHVFLCGNPVMIRAVDQGLRERGFTLCRKRGGGQIHKERYW